MNIKTLMRMSSYFLSTLPKFIVLSDRSNIEQIVKRGMQPARQLRSPESTGIRSAGRKH